MTVKGLLVMDVDSTLIQEEVIDLLGEKAGHKEVIADITARAMAGQLQFEEALAERVKLLEGLPISIWDDIREEIHYTEGAKELVAELKKRGYKIGLVSGGFHEIVDRLAEELNLDYVCANRMEVMDQKLTGRTSGPIVTKDTKVACLKQWASENNLELNQTIAMGDGANDIPMILTAGIGVAFCAKASHPEIMHKITEPNLYHLMAIIDKLS
ncbi:phosphoserine phosphatase SerB [Streptococcus plurextorum]|uniref:phosphoserine phosphatase SerB n=1 Tax=Streptococcus plurextorum TaxID=456876 RepID=UPI00041B27F6|nr:phosphoserine phosphatase SerB [Streptococcus plurextorum]